MIPRTTAPRHIPAWQSALAEAITDPRELLEVLELDLQLLADARRAAAQFGLRVPRGYVARMHKGDPRDPLLRQVLPLGAECEPSVGFVGDPVGDLQAMAVPGLLHKYRGRALLVSTGACAIHCRYCFRRHFPYNDANPAENAWREALNYLRAERSISEVILSGGDPLVLNDRRLGELIQALDTIAHLRTLRIHTRQPVVLPERIDDGLLSCLHATRLHKVVVIHANHAREIDAGVTAALAQLRSIGATLLNQAVLLRGVNDSVSALQALSEAVFATGTLPYYLHLLDRVQGAAHFEVPQAEATELIRVLNGLLPGYLVPRLVREEPGKPGKTPLPPNAAGVGTP